MYRVRLAVDVPVTVVAGLAVVLPYALSEPLIDEHCPCSAADVNRFDRRAIGNTNPAANWASDVTVALALFVPLAADTWLLRPGKAWFEDVVVFAETLAINGALVTAAKYISQRPLPRTYAAGSQFIDEPGGYRAFYSGHTSVVFSMLSAASMTARLRYGEHVWPWVITALAGTSVAIERVADGRHFPTDVIVGAVVGSAVGIAVPLLHARTDLGGAFLMPRRDGIFLGWAGRL